MTDPTELALLRGVCESPAEDTPRLVLADWLDEHDRPEPCPTCRGAGLPRPSVADMPPVRERVAPGGRVERYQEWPAFDFREPRCETCKGSGSVPVAGRRERAADVPRPANLH